MIKIRLSFDNQQDKKEALKVLQESFNVKSVSKDYVNRDNKSFRVYVDVEIKDNEGE